MKIHLPSLSVGQWFTAGTAALAATRGVAAAPVQQPLSAKPSPLPSQPLLDGLAVPAINITRTAASTQFAMIGDYGYAGDALQAVSDMVKSWNPDFISTQGDNNYPLGAMETFDHNVAQYFHKFIQFTPVYQGAYSLRGAKHNNFFPALGNHDWMTGEAQPYLRTFALPGNGRFYNVRRGPVELFVIDSDPNEPKGVHKSSHQAKWLEKALSDSKAKWKIVTMHQAPYSTGHHGSNLWMQWPFEKWGASVVVAGHDHFYERIILKGFPYFVNGVGGAPLDKPTHDANIPGASEDVTYSERHGAVRVHADSHLLLFCFFNDKRHLIDSFAMPKHSHTFAKKACQSLD